MGFKVVFSPTHLHFGALLPRPLLHPEFLLQLREPLRHVVNLLVQLPVLGVVLVEYRLVLPPLLNRLNAREPGRILN